MPITSTATASDAGKYIAEELIARTEQLHRLPQMCDSRNLEPGNGKTANFIQYNRTDVPLAPITEGVTPVETPFTVTTKAVTAEEWGLYIALTNVSILTTKHPVFNESLNLLADAIARAEDYGVAEVLDAGTNVQFWDGTRANRAAIVSTDVFKANVFNKARADLNDLGTPTREGDLFVVVVGPQVEADILAESAAVGSFTAAHQLAGNDKLEKGVVASWLGFKIVRSNFLPKFTRLTTVGAPAVGAGGALAGNVFFKVTRKNTQRGFEEDIAVEGSQAMGANTSLTWTFPATAGFVYNVYAGGVTGDANLFLASSNNVAGSTFQLTALPGAGANPPATPAAAITVHPMYIFGAGCVDMVPLPGGRVEGMLTPDASSDSDPLKQRRKMGSKYFQKAGIRDQNRFKRVELVSNF